MIYRFLLSFFLCILPFGFLLSQGEDLDKTLRDELGVKQKETKKKDKTTKTPEEQEPPETNPVQERYAAPEESSSSTLLWILVRIFLVLAILVGAFYYILQFLNRNRNARYPVKGEMKLLSQLTLAPGKEIQIVEVSGMLFLLGVSENSVQLIKEITDPMIRERIFAAKESFEPSNETFLEQLFHTVKGTGRSPKVDLNPEEDSEVIEEIQKRQKARLEEIRKERDRMQKKELDRDSKSTDF